MHPPPHSSIHLPLAPSFSTQLYPSPPSSFQSPPSSLQHPQCYKNQNMICNWVISQNLGWTIQSCPFCLKIGTPGILEKLIPNLDLNFWNSNPKIYFLANLGQKSCNCPFCLNIGRHGIFEKVISNPELDFRNSVLKIQFWANLGQ